jgi:hypothetical protein
MPVSFFDLTPQQQHVAERALLEMLMHQEWIVLSGNDADAAPLFRISVPEYMEQHYAPEVHWEHCAPHLPAEEHEAVRTHLQRLHHGETYQYGLRQRAREHFEVLFRVLYEQFPFAATERQGVWRHELPEGPFGIERVLDVLVQFEDIRSMGGLERAWLTVRYASAGGAHEVWSCALSEDVNEEQARTELQQALAGINNAPRDQLLMQVLQLIEEVTQRIQKVEDTLLWTQPGEQGISVGVVDTDELVVFAHTGEVDQWNREEEFLRLSLSEPLKASTLEGLREDIDDWRQAAS